MATEDELENCPGCGAQPHSYHDEDCDHAKCPDCGEQLLFHECEVASEPHVPAVWHGIDPCVEVAHTLGWWTTRSGVIGPVEDYTRVLVAAALGQIRWDRDAQRYTIGVIDETALDTVLQ